MFRKLKKLYFKIYHLFKLIGVFVVVFGLSNKVYAEECINLYKGTPGNLYKYNGNMIQIFSSLDGINTYQVNTDPTCNEETQICLNTSKSYTLYAINNGEYVPLLKSFRQGYILGRPIYSSANDVYEYTFRPLSGTIPVFRWNLTNAQYGDGSEFNRINTYQFMLVEGTEKCIPSTPEPEPDNNVYSGFLTIYFDRIVYLAEGFTNNPYLIAMVGIIFGFVVLDLLLKIINIRRKK